MEREALERSLHYLCARINMKELVTDASTSVTKFLGIHTVRHLYCYNHFHKCSYEVSRSFPFLGYMAQSKKAQESTC